MTDRLFKTSRDLNHAPIGSLPVDASALAGCGSGLIACLLAVAAAGAANADTPTIAQALSLKPVQAGIDYERVPPDLAKDCRVEDLDGDDWSGWRVVSPDGTLLRRFADTNGDKRVDLWCYFRYGVEVYRDVDGDFNGKADQYRWLGTAGTRWGLDEDEDGTIDRWKSISPEEVSAELVAALRDRDLKRFTALLGTRDELREAGLAGERLESITEKSQRATRDFKDFVGGLTTLGPKARWIQFAGSVPGVVPASSAETSRDLTVYENAIAMYEDGDQNGQLLMGTLVEVEGGWRLIELPSVVRGGEPIAQSSGSFFNPTVVASPVESAAAGMGEATQDLVNRLETVDRELASAKDPEQIAKLHATRADLVEELIAAASDRQDRETWIRQLIDTVGMAVQSGAYPRGLDRLKSIANRYARGDEALAAYAIFQAIGAEYVDRQSETDADFAKVQEWYLEKLTDFVDRFPETPEAAQAWLQLALSKEFEEKEREALVFYKKVAVGFPGTDAGEKAAGAVRRLDSVGRPLELAGRTLGGKSFDMSMLRGRPVIVHYWATWCEPCKQDMKLLRRLQAQYQRSRLAIVGVNVDIERDLAAKFVNESRLSWTQLFAEGGLERSPLAKRYGVQTLPTMMLVDGSGKVVEHNIRAAELADALDRMLK